MRPRGLHQVPRPATFIPNHNAPRLHLPHAHLHMAFVLLMPSLCASAAHVPSCACVLCSCPCSCSCSCARVLVCSCARSRACAAASARVLACMLAHVVVLVCFLLVCLCVCSHPLLLLSCTPLTPGGQRPTGAPCARITPAKRHYPDFIPSVHRSCACVKTLLKSNIREFRRFPHESKNN